MMKINYFNFLLFLAYIYPDLTNGLLDLYKGQDFVTFDCSTELNEAFSCICLHSGLWRIHSSCQDFHHIGVKNKHCFHPNERIKRIKKISSESSLLTVTTDGGSLEKLIEFNRGSSLIVLNEIDIIVASKTKTISDGVRKFCLNGFDSSRFFDDGTNRGSYCIFKVTNYLKSIVSVEEGCDFADDLIQLNPFECHEIVQDASLCPEMNDFDTFGENVLFDLTRKKRMFLPTPNETSPPLADASDPEEDDEDFFKSNETNSEPNPAVATEVWNYIDKKLDLILGLGTPVQKEQKIPIFKILEQSKKVMKKTCPSFYVKPDFLDLALDVFIGLLTKREFFHEFGNDLEGISRVMESLKNCESNLTTWPFIDESADQTCDPNSNKTRGVYQKFGQKLEVSITQQMTSWNYDPFIDTVWKIFTNAHQYCFAFFDPAYNDHHRYGTMVEALFQGSIYDIWNSSKTTPDLFAGFLGNVQELTDNVTYCAVTSSLNTKYPWDIPRPAKETELKRKKRSTSSSLNGAANCYLDSFCTDSYSSF